MLFLLFVPLFFTFILSANKLLGFMNYCQCPIENYECGFFFILTSTFNLQGNYWGILFIYMLLDCELILGLFYIFSIKSYNSYLFMLFIFDLFFFDIYFLYLSIYSLFTFMLKNSIGLWIIEINSVARLSVILFIILFIINY